MYLWRKVDHRRLVCAFITPSIVPCFRTNNSSTQCALFQSLCPYEGGGGNKQCIFFSITENSFNSRIWGRKNFTWVQKNPLSFLGCIFLFYLRIIKLEIFLIFWGEIQIFDSQRWSVKSRNRKQHFKIWVVFTSNPYTDRPLCLSSLSGSACRLQEGRWAGGLTAGDGYCGAGGGRRSAREQAPMSWRIT